MKKIDLSKLENIVGGKRVSPIECFGAGAMIMASLPTLFVTSIPFWSTARDCWNS